VSALEASKRGVQGDSPVDASVVALSDEEFGGEVFHGAAQGVGLVAQGQPHRKAEVAHLEVPRLVDQDVFRLAKEHSNLLN